MLRREMEGLSKRGRLERLVSAVGSTRLLGILVVASVVLPALLFAAFSYLSYQAHIRAAETRLVQTLYVVHEHIGKIFETHQLAILHVRDLLRDRSDDDIRQGLPALRSRLTELKAALPQVRDIWVIDADGHLISSAVIDPPRQSMSFADREHFRILKEGHEGSYISDLLQSRLGRGTFFVLSQRWTDEHNRFRGIVAISIEPSYFHTFFSGFPGGHVFSLVKSSGEILARYPYAPEAGHRLPSQRGLLAEITRAPDQGIYHAVSSIDGIERIAAYRRLSPHPVYVTANFGMSEVMKAWRNDIASHALLAGPATFGLFLITLLAYGQARRERRALDQLRQEVDLRQRTEAQLVQAQKMEAVGRLTGGIAHDFNNLLTVIMGNLETIARHAPKANERVKRAIENAQRGAERAASLTHRLLAFSRRQPLEMKLVDFNELVTGMQELLRRSIGETVTIETRLAAGLWIARTDPNQAENALINLVINARDAMPEGGRLTIETANVSVPATDEAARKEGLAAGRYVLLSVADNGTGMPPDVLDMVFEPFFTTKAVGRGTGLGLSMVYGFMKQSNGHVRVESEVGRGTVVRLYFPRSDGAPSALAPKSEIPVETTGAGETILVCEDDEGVRNFSAQILRDHGYRVIEAVDMTEALEKLRDNPQVSALFTDVVLPGEGNGRTLADTARRVRPDLKVLFTSGYARDAIVEGGHLEDGIELLNKPFSSAELARRIRALLA